jgi:hypothetical protein
MEPTQQIHSVPRRSFFKKILRGIAGGWFAGNLFSNVFHSAFLAREKKEIQVSIHPLAVPRAKNKDVPHGA